MQHLPDDLAAAATRFEKHCVDKRDPRGGDRPLLLARELCWSLQEAGCPRPVPDCRQACDTGNLPQHEAAWLESPRAFRQFHPTAKFLHALARAPQSAVEWLR